MKTDLPPCGTSAILPDPSVHDFTGPFAPLGGPYAPCARAVAVHAHAGQKDKAGADYIHHPAAVAAAFVADDILQSIAWLHDVLEDSGWTAQDLRQAGLCDAIIEAVQAMTRDPEEDYFDYIRRVAAHPLARQVKRADLLHNQDVRRLTHIGSGDLLRMQRYAKATAIIEAALESCPDDPSRQDPTDPQTKQPL